MFFIYFVLILVGSSGALEPVRHHDKLSNTRVNKIDDTQDDSNYGIYDDDYGGISRNVTRKKSLNIPREWEISKPTLTFPKNQPDNHFKMGGLIIENKLLSFDFLHDFLRFIQPYNVSIDFIVEIIEMRVTSQRLLSESVHMELGFMMLLGVCCILACVIPGTELWLACRPIREDYKPSQHPGCLAFILSALLFILGIGIFGLIIANEVAKIGVEKIVPTVETAIQDLSDYHSGTTGQIRQCLTRSLDVASEAMMADLDNVEELLGKPVQLDLASETGLDESLDQLFSVTNESQELANRADILLKEAERARDLGMELGREIDGLRRELESVVGDCISQDRSVCATVNPAGMTVTLRIEQLLRDERLLRLRGVGRDNLTEAGRQARGEYLYVPHYIARNTLDSRNNIRREINVARAKIFDEARGIESTKGELNSQLNNIRRIVNEAVPYIELFEESRWLVCIGAIAALAFFWTLMFSAIICRCGSSQRKVRSTLLCGAFWSCPISIGLCAVLAAALAVSSHMEMFVCRALEDPNYRTMEAIIESKMFLGKRLNVPLKDLLEKCEQNEGMYPALPLGKSSKLEQLADYWKWSGLSQSLSSLKVDLKGLKILTPSLEGKLESLFHACGPNLTEHRIFIRGPILNRDLGAMSDHVYGIARQLVDQRISRNLQDVGASMRNILNQRVKPLVEIQDNLVDQLTRLELQLRPFRENINKTLVHLKNMQSHIDNQGDVIAQLRTKYYVETLSGYLDQWRSHVLSEIISGAAKCRPLWDIVNGLRLLMCQNILGPLNSFWFLMLLSILIMIISTPIAHTLASVYRNDLEKVTIFTPPRSGSPDTVIIDRDTWRTPDPPPLQDNWSNSN